MPDNATDFKSVFCVFVHEFHFLKAYFTLFFLLHEKTVSFTKLVSIFCHFSKEKKKIKCFIQLNCSMKLLLSIRCVSIYLISFCSRFYGLSKVSTLSQMIAHWIVYFMKIVKLATDFFINSFLWDTLSKKIIFFFSVLYQCYWCSFFPAITRREW